MNAKEARELTNNFNIENRYVNHVMDQIYAKIKEQAKIGQSNLIYVFHNIDFGRGSFKYQSKIKEVCIKQLRKDGYEFIDGDPDPCHPASRSYNELKW